MKYILTLLCAILCYPVGYFVLDNHADKQILVQQKQNSSPKSIEYSVGAYVINLDRSIGRYEYVKNTIYKLGLPLERISAVDGATLSPEQIKQVADLQSYNIFLGHAPERGTIGCSLSHIKAWQKFLDSNLDFAVIFEDDISFEPEKLRSTIDNLIENQTMWDVVSFEIHHRGMPLTIKSLSNRQNLVIYLTNVSHAGAYMLNRSAAEKLLAKALPIKMPIDHYFTRGWELDIKFTGIEPRLVHQTFGQSDIAQTKTFNHDQKISLGYIRRALYTIQSSLIRFIYNLKIYSQLI